MCVLVQVKQMSDNSHSVIAHTWAETFFFYLRLVRLFCVLSFVRFTPCTESHVRRCCSYFVAISAIWSSNSNLGRNNFLIDCTEFFSSFFSSSSRLVRCQLVQHFTVYFKANVMCKNIWPINNKKKNKKEAEYRIKCEQAQSPQWLTKCCKRSNRSLIFICTHTMHQTKFMRSIDYSPLSQMRCFSVISMAWARTKDVIVSFAVCSCWIEWNMILDDIDRLWIVWHTQCDALNAHNLREAIINNLIALHK